MKPSLIPWKEFLEALTKQNPRPLEPWLRGWLFADEGVIEADPEFVTLYSKFHVVDFKGAAESSRAGSVL